jgi:hypothetical protein
MNDNEYSRMSLLQLLFNMFQPVGVEDTQAQLERLYNRF